MADNPDALFLHLLAVAQYHLHSASLSGTSPFLSDLQAALTHPQPGDWVMETSTIWLPERDPHRFGRLIVTRQEIIPYADDEEAAENEHEVLTDRLTYLELLDRHGLDHPPPANRTQ